MTLGSTRGRSVGPFTIGTSRAPQESCLLLQCGGGTKVPSQRRRRSRSCSCRGPSSGAAAAGGRRPGLHFFHGRREPRTSALSRIEYGVKYDGQRDRGKTTGCKKGGEGNGSRTGYRMSTLPDVLPGQSVHYIDGDEGHRRRSLASQTYSRSTGLG